MKKFKFLVLFLAGGLTCAALTACGGNGGTVSHEVTAEQWKAAFSTENLLQNVTIEMVETTAYALVTDEVPSWDSGRTRKHFVRIDTAKQIIHTAHWDDGEKFDEQQTYQIVYTKEGEHEYTYETYSPEEGKMDWWRREPSEGMNDCYSHQLKYGVQLWQLSAFEDYTYNEEQKQYELNNDALELYAWESFNRFGFRFHEPSVIIKFKNGKVSFIEISGYDPDRAVQAEIMPYLKQTMTFSNYGTTKVSIPKIAG